MALLKSQLLICDAKFFLVVERMRMKREAGEEGGKKSFSVGFGYGFGYVDPGSVKGREGVTIL